MPIALMSGGGGGGSDHHEVHSLLRPSRGHPHAPPPPHAVRNTGEITALAGCDRLTIGPSLLEQLAASTAAVPQKLSAAAAAEACKEEKVHFDEAAFR